MQLLRVYVLKGLRGVKDVIRLFYMLTLVREMIQLFASCAHACSAVANNTILCISRDLDNFAAVVASAGNQMTTFLQIFHDQYLIEADF